MDAKSFILGVACSLLYGCIAAYGLFQISIQLDRLFGLLLVVLTLLTYFVFIPLLLRVLAEIGFHILHDGTS